MTSATQPSEKVKSNKVVTRSQSRKHSDLKLLIDSHEREIKLLRKLRVAESDIFYWCEHSGERLKSHSLFLQKIEKHLAATRKIEASLLKLAEPKDPTTSLDTSRSGLQKCVSQLSSSLNTLSEDLESSFSEVLIYFAPTNA